jgi:hypothetical protein
MEVSGQRHAPATLYPRERTPGTHWIGGWVGPRAGIDTEAREETCASAGDRIPVVQSVVYGWVLQSMCVVFVREAADEIRIMILFSNPSEQRK